MHGIFLELTLVLILAGGIALFVSFFKQPSIIAYIIAGLLLGPIGHFHLAQYDTLQGLAQIGIALLLFMVGLELDVAQFKRMGKAAVIVGVGQIIIMVGLGFLILTLLGLAVKSALFLAVALAFSSTIIVVKLLAEKKDLESLYGKIAIGILLIEDFVAVIALIILSSIGGNDAHLAIPLWHNILFTVAKAFLLLGVIYFSGKFILPRILKYVGRSDELLLIFSLSWALGLAAFVSLPFIGFSLEIGGFLAGIALANSAVHYQIGARIQSLRDFFIIIFFIVLGSHFTIGNIQNLIVPGIILSLFVLILKPFLIFMLLTMLGYKSRTAFFTGAVLSQISEFSLILAALGFKLGYLGEQEIGLITLVAIITIALSSYTILYDQKLFDWLRKHLAKFERTDSEIEHSSNKVQHKNHIVLVGAHRLGGQIIESLKHQKLPFVILDFNPEVTEKYAKEGLNAICGDITDPMIQELVNLTEAKLVISTVLDIHDNFILAEVAKKPPIRTRLVVAAYDERQAEELYEKGVDYVILPHFIGGLHLSKLFKNGYKFTELKKLRDHQLELFKSKPVV